MNPISTGGSTIYWTEGSTATGTTNGTSSGSSTVDWSGDYLADTAATTSSKAIGMDLPTFIVVQSQLSGDGTGRLPAA